MPGKIHISHSTNSLPDSLQDSKLSCCRVWLKMKLFSPLCFGEVWYLMNKNQVWSFTLRSLWEREVNRSDRNIYFSAEIDENERQKRKERRRGVTVFRWGGDLISGWCDRSCALLSNGKLLRVWEPFLHLLALYSSSPPYGFQGNGPITLLITPQVSYLNARWVEC